MCGLGSAMASFSLVRACVHDAGHHEVDGLSGLGSALAYASVL